MVISEGSSYREDDTKKENFVKEKTVNDFFMSIYFNIFFSILSSKRRRKIERKAR